jgi:hypothetical protein
MNVLAGGGAGVDRINAGNASDGAGVGGIDVGGRPGRSFGSGGGGGRSSLAYATAGSGAQGVVIVRYLTNA